MILSPFSGKKTGDFLEEGAGLVMPHEIPALSGRTTQAPRAFSFAKSNGAAIHVDSARAGCGGAGVVRGLELRRPAASPRLLWRLRRAVFHPRHARRVACAPGAGAKPRTISRLPARPSTRRRSRGDPRPDARR